MTITKFDEALFTAYQRTSGGLSTLTEEFAQFDQQIRNVGKTTSVGAIEAAQSLIGIADAVKTPKEALKVLNESLLLEAAGITKIGSATSLVATVLKTFRKENLDAATVVDILGGAALRGRLDLDALSMSLRLVGPAAASSGTPFKQLMSGFIVLQNNGLQGRRAIFGMSSAIDNLKQPGSSLSKLLAEWGVKTTDSTGKMNSFKDILNDTSTAISGNIKRTSQLEDASAAFAKLAENASEYNKSLKEIGNSRELLKQNAAEVENTLPNAWKKLSATAQDALISMGENLRGPLIGLLKELSATLLQVSGSINSEAVTSLGNSLVSLVGSLPKIVNGLAPIVKLMGDFANFMQIVIIGTAKLKNFTVERIKHIKEDPMNLLMTGSAEKAWEVANTKADVATWDTGMFPTGAGIQEKRDKLPLPKSASNSSTPVSNSFTSMSNSVIESFKDNAAVGGKQFTTMVEIMGEIYTIDIQTRQQLTERLTQLHAEWKKRAGEVPIAAPAIQG
jgi:TP901 family phage tail tape measure protein